MDDDRWLYALALSSVASGIIGLLVPLYLVRLGANAAALGVSASISALVGAPGAVLAGRYADRTGRRRDVIIAALLVVGVSAGALPLVSSITITIAVNAVLALAVAGISPVVTMLVVANVPEQGWTVRIAKLNAYQGYGATAGLVIGMVWATVAVQFVPPLLAQRSLFVIAAAIGIASVVVALRSMPATDTLRIGPRKAGRVVTLLARTNRRVRDATFTYAWNRVFWATLSFDPGRLVGTVRKLPTGLVAYFLGAFVFFIGFAAFWAPLPLYFIELGFTSGPVFGLYLLNNVASTVLFGAAGRLSARYELRVVQAGALGLRGLMFASVSAIGMLAVGGAIGTVTSLAVAGGGLLLVGVTWAFISVAGTAIVSRYAPAGTRGGVLGSYTAISAVGGSLGSLLGGGLATASFTLAFVVAGALVALGAGIVLSMRLFDRPSTSGRS